MDDNIPELQLFLDDSAWSETTMSVEEEEEAYDVDDENSTFAVILVNLYQSFPSTPSSSQTVSASPPSSPTPTRTTVVPLDHGCPHCLLPFPVDPVERSHHLQTCGRPLPAAAAAAASTPPPPPAPAAVPKTCGYCRKPKPTNAWERHLHRVLCMGSPTLSLDRKLKRPCAPTQFLGEMKEKKRAPKRRRVVDDNDPAHEFVVDKILDHHLDENQALRFQVKWLNREDGVTWEPATNFVDFDANGARSKITGPALWYTRHHAPELEPMLLECGSQ